MTASSRVHAHEERQERIDRWELSLHARRLKSTDGELLRLSNAQFSLLVAMLGAPQRVLSRDQLIGLSRLYTDEVYDRSVDAQVARLRRKIESDPRNPHYIPTERGAGYCFAVSVHALL